MPSSPSLAAPQDNYAKLVALAKADHERRLAPHAEALTKIQQELAPLEASLAIKPWPRRWWGYLKSCSLCYKVPWFLVIVLPGLAFLASKHPPLTKLIALAVILIATLGVVFIGRDELKLQIKHRKPQLRDLEADEATIVASYLNGRLAPAGIYTCEINGKNISFPAGHFAFEYSAEATKQAVWALPMQASRLAKTRGYSPEIKLAIWSSQQFAADQDRMAERVARVTRQLIAIGRWAWQDGTLDYRYEGNAEHLAVALAVIELHERLDRLWRFGQPDAEIDVTTTLASAEWADLEARVAELHAAGYALLPD